jgi:hypothetical protein
MLEVGSYTSMEDAELQADALIKELTENNFGYALPKIYGADIYFSLKYTIFNHWKCGAKAKKILHKKTEGNAPPRPCPAWER